PEKFLSARLQERVLQQPSTETPRKALRLKDLVFPHGLACVHRRSRRDPSFCSSRSRSGQTRCPQSGGVRLSGLSLLVVQMPYAASWPGKKWLSKRRGRENEKDSVSGFWCALLGLAVAACFAPAATAQEVPSKPYIELGAAGAFGPKDELIVAWQTDESA